MDTDKVVCFNDEVMLLAWSDNNTRGRTVTFLLPEEGEAHPFRETKVKSGKSAGQRYRMVLVEIGDDERPVERTPSQLCYLLCKNQMFQRFLDERSFDTIDSEESARTYVLKECGIDSRSKLDHSMHARATWEASIYQPWLNHCEALKKSMVG